MRSMMTALVAGVLLCAPMAAADEAEGDYARDGGYLAMGSLFSWVSAARLSCGLK